MSSLFRSRNSFFANKRENELKEVLINALRENTREIQYESQEFQRETLNLCEATSSLCITLEAIFLHGLKDSLLWQTLNVISNDVDRRPDPSFWPPLMVFLHKQVFEQIQLLSQINTEIGQCRAWIRLSLNECLLSAYLKNIRDNSSALRPYYRNYALLKDVERLDIITRLLEGLESAVAFDLPFNTSLLNQWPDLALQMSGLWSPALKSIQISSGVDIAGTLSTQTAPIPTPMPVQSNEFFSESISNSPFARSSTTTVSLAQCNNQDNQHVEQILHKIEEITNGPDDDDDADNDGDNLDLSTDFLHGNSLSNLMQTSWSAEFKSPQKNSTQISSSNENVGGAASPSLQRSQSMTSSTSSLRALLPHRFSYNALLRNHENNRQVDWTEVWEKFLLQNPTPNTRMQSEEHEENTNNDTSNFELLCAGLEKFDIVELQEMVEQLCHLAHEPGLNAQGFLCRTCQHPLGIGYINFQVCAFSGYYFCHNCMSSDVVLIPARIIYNWDFRKYSVSKRAAAFLAEFSDQPFIDLKSLNPHIYKAIDSMAELQSLRIRLNFIRVYLMTCGGDAMDNLQRQFFGKAYLYEHIHQYSIADLAMIQRGTLYQILQKAYKMGEAHILKCALCSVKGFICEICKSQHVLYPFHIDTTFRCQICGAVYHPACLNEQQPCPKCLRMRKREEQQQQLLREQQEDEQDKND